MLANKSQHNHFKDLQLLYTSYNKEIVLLNTEYDFLASQDQPYKYI